MGARVVSSLTAPATTSERRTKPEPSSTSPRVSRGQSLRFSLEWPRSALGWAAASPSKKLLLRSYSVTVWDRPNRSGTGGLDRRAPR